LAEWMGIEMNGYYDIEDGQIHPQRRRDMEKMEELGEELRIVNAKHKAIGARLQELVIKVTGINRVH
jgi:hypothetical protein